MTKADLMKSKKLLLPSFLVFALLAGCSTSSETIEADRTYHAYGSTWKYIEVHHYSTGWGFNTSHGIVGKVSKISQTAYLAADNGEKIPVHERIFALQKDGHYKKASCCDHAGAFIDLYQVEGKLVLKLMQTRANVTDCWAYPVGMSSDTMPNERKVYRVNFYGDFNPNSKRFEVADFVSEPATQDEIRKKYGNNPDRNQEIELTYSKRKPLICGDDAVGDSKERDK